MIIYTHDVPDIDALVEEGVAHVRAHLSAVADADDDPETNADDVVIAVQDHPDDPTMKRIVGTLEAEPVAPYLDPDYDPWAGVDHDTFAAAIEAAISDQEVIDRGQA